MLLAFSKIPTWVWLLLLSAWALVAFTSCTTAPAVLTNVDVFYKRDMGIEVNGFKANGTLVVPQSASYAIEVKSRGDLDVFTLESCHREEVTQGEDKKFKFNYVPTKGLEDTGACPVRFAGYEKNKGRNSWGLIDFEDAKTVLPAVLKCNGNTIQSRGVSICQSKVGLIEQIEFPVEVIVNPDPGCSMPRPVDLKTYRFNMSPKECVFNFMEKGIARREHRLTTAGYAQVLVEE